MDSSFAFRLMLTSSNIASDTPSILESFGTDISTFVLDIEDVPSTVLVSCLWGVVFNCGVLSPVTVDSALLLFELSLLLPNSLL